MSFKIAFVYPGYENLGIEYLSANLKKNGFNVRLFLDPILFSESGFINVKFLASFFSFQEFLLHQITNFQPDLICFSVITDNYHWACNWAKKIKQRLSAPIVFGGIHPTSVPDKVILEPFVDYVCVGEGDIALVELAKALRDKKSTTSILNIWTKNNGKIFKNEVAPPIPDLDSLPFPDKELYYSQFPIFSDGYLVSTSRGCPFHCAYCCNSVYHSLYSNKGRVIRRRSCENVLTELEQARYKYQPKFIHFIDEVFNYDREWIFGFLKRYKKDIALPFSCYIFPNQVDRSISNLLKEAGCFKVQMGLQVIDDYKRTVVLQRPSTKKDVAEAIRCFKNSGIFVTCDNIFGFPDESEDELISLCHFYHKHMPDHCETFWLRYYPGTEITRWALKKNYIDKEKLKKIENGDIHSGLIRNAEQFNKKTYAQQIILFLNIYKYFPAAFRILILKYRWYRILPRVPIVLLLIIFKVIRRPVYDFNTLRTVKRYLYFCAKRLQFSFGLIGRKHHTYNYPPN